MAKHGKKYMAALAKVDLDKFYGPQDAVKLVKETSYAKFDATVEVHMRMGLDPRQADQQVRDVVVLPHGLGKAVRVLVFAQGDGATNARNAGADTVADDEETLTKIQGVQVLHLQLSDLAHLSTRHIADLLTVGNARAFFNPGGLAQ